MEFSIDEDIQKLSLAIAEAKQNNRSKQFIEKLEENICIVHCSLRRGEEQHVKIYK